MVEGVRQDTLDNLQRTLLALLGEYERGKQADVRKLVIAAKERAKWTSKQENALWMLTWLENPPLFPQWAALRRAALNENGG